MHAGTLCAVGRGRRNSDGSGVWNCRLLDFLTVDFYRVMLLLMVGDINNVIMTKSS